MVETIKTVSSELPADAVPVSIAITGQGDGLWAVTDEGKPVGNAILWSDSRAAPILDQWAESGRLDVIVAHCGSSPYLGMSLPLLAWLAHEQPKRFARVDTVLSCKDWLSYRLTGERTLDPTEATVHYLDKETGTYDRDVFDLVGIPDGAETLPRLTAPTEIIGNVTEAAARETTLPVVSRPFDVPASAIGEYRSLEAAVERIVDIEIRYEPRPDAIDAYDELYDLFVDIREGMDPLWTRRETAYREGINQPTSD